MSGESKYRGNGLVGGLAVIAGILLVANVIFISIFINR